METREERGRHLDGGIRDRAGPRACCSLSNRSSRSDQLSACVGQEADRAGRRSRHRSAFASGAASSCGHDTFSTAGTCSAVRTGTTRPATPCMLLPSMVSDHRSHDSATRAGSRSIQAAPAGPATSDERRPRTPAAPAATARATRVGAHGYRRPRAPAGTVPMRPRWKSSNAWANSAWVFITNGPCHAIGSPIGRPPSTSTSNAGVRLS